MTLVKKRTPELREKEKQVKMGIIENIFKIQALGFTTKQIWTVCEEKQNIISQFLLHGSDFYFKIERAEKMLKKLLEFADNCKNPEYITMLKLRDKYEMPNATMQELVQEAEKRAKEKYDEYIKKFINV